MVVLKQFQKNLFHVLRSLVRISWDTGVPLGGKDCFYSFISNFIIEVANQAKHYLICKYIYIIMYVKNSRGCGNMQKQNKKLQRFSKNI